MNNINNKNDKIQIYIDLQYIYGPILKSRVNKNGKYVTGIKVIDNDSTIQKLDNKINKLWCTLYSGTSFDRTTFNELKEMEVAPKLLEMIEKLIKRLNEVNDGTFEVVDMITEYLKNLIKSQSI